MHSETFPKYILLSRGRDIPCPLDEIDLFCLHVVYLPRINFTLKKFAESWDYHPLSSENNRFPSIWGSAVALHLIHNHQK